jgi:UDP-N-acetyl-D-mannosaminuronic acid dehydrogenase
MNLLKASQQQIVNALKEGAFKTTIVGMGTVGSYTAAEFLRAGAQVIGADIRSDIVEAINHGTGSLFDPEIREIFRNKVSEGKLTGTTDVASAVSDSKVICINVPTLLDRNGNPDLNHLKSATKTVSEGLRRDSLVMLCSTVSVGTTRRVVLPLLQQRGLTIGDFGLAFTPERMVPGVSMDQLAKIPRIVSGIDETSKRVAHAIMKTLISQVVPVSSTEVAEATKLFENTFRDVNIALVNELAIYLMRLGVNALEVVEAASTKYNVVAHYPGAGVGGYCIPVSPRYLAQQSSSDELQIVKLARKVNDNMPRYIVNLARNTLFQLGKPIEHAKVSVLGLAYKENLSDLRWSSSIQIVEQLKVLGAEVSLHDPYASNEDVNKMYNLSNLPLEEAVKGSDCIIIATGHREFKELPFEKIRSIMNSDPVIIDGRNILNMADVINKGFVFCGVGRILSNSSGPVQTHQVAA